MVISEVARSTPNLWRGSADACSGGDPSSAVWAGGASSVCVSGVSAGCASAAASSGVSWPGFAALGGGAGGDGQQQQRQQQAHGERCGLGHTDCLHLSLLGWEGM